MRPENMMQRSTVSLSRSCRLYPSPFHDGLPRGQVDRQREPHSEVAPLDSEAALMRPPCSINARTTAMNGRKVRSSMIGSIVLLATLGTASAQEAAKPAITGPIFSNTGPDAAAYYGAAEGFPLGTLATASQMQHLVASYSHFDELTPARIVARPPHCVVV
jgi:hypothetical protein